MAAVQFGKNQIFVFDSAVPDLQQLVESVGEGQKVIILDANKDGITQLAEALQGESGLDAIHVFSHGSVGALYLGSAVLDQATLPGYSQALAQIGRALGESGDLLLYGCNVAQGDVGRAFITQLAEVTGADVAASTDLTGAFGNWQLEFSVGPVESSAVELDGQILVSASLSTPNNTIESIFIANGGSTAGKISILADFAKAAYNLGNWEKTGDNAFINDIADSGGPTRSASAVYQELTSSEQWMAPALSVTPETLYLRQEGLPDPSGFFSLFVSTNWSSVAPVGFVPAGTVVIGPPELGGTQTVYAQIAGGFESGIFSQGGSAALVMVCGDSVVLAFRGTNDNRMPDPDSGTINGKDILNRYGPDVGDWNAMSNHYENLEPLVGALNTYVSANANIKYVYVTGHSLGGAMALRYMHDHADTANVKYESVTFAAPAYYDVFKTHDSRITNIEIQGDPVPELGGVFDPQGDILYFYGSDTATNGAANHSMDYYRSIAHSLDDATWSQLLAKTSETDVLIGASRSVGLGMELFQTTIGIDNLNTRAAAIAADGDDGVIGGRRHIDVVYGGIGNDTLAAQDGDITLRGAGGDDSYWIKRSSGDVYDIYESSGIDTLYLQDTSNIVKLNDLNGRTCRIQNCRSPATRRCSNFGHFTDV